MFSKNDKHIWLGLGECFANILIAFCDISKSGNDRMKCHFPLSTPLGLVFF
jgi:hypothetical protein